MPVPIAKIPQSGSFQIRPRYCECDPMGVVHHASYIPWLEMGRTELLRGAGVTYAQMEAAGLFLVIVKLECRYRRAGRYDELLEVRTNVTGGSRVKIEHSYEIVRVDGGGGPIGESIFAATSTLACVDAQGKPIAMPEWLVPSAK